MENFDIVYDHTGRPSPIKNQTLAALPYPGGHLAVDLVLLALLVSVESCRIFFGW
jgi:hypothetical protein